MRSRRSRRSGRRLFRTLVGWEPVRLKAGATVLPTTVSLGVATGPPSNCDALVRLAAALYSAEQNGRNQVVVSPPEGYVLAS